MRSNSSTDTACRKEKKIYSKPNCKISINNKKGGCDHMRTTNNIMRIINAFMAVSLLLAIVISASITTNATANKMESDRVQPQGCPITETCCGGEGPCDSCNYNYYEKWHYARVCDYCAGQCSAWFRVADPCGWCGP